MQQPIQQQSLKEFDFGYYIQHYVHLLWRWKFYIIFAVPIVIAGVFVSLTNYEIMKPELEAAVMLGLETTEGKTAVDDIGELPQLSRLQLIKAKGFLSDIVEKLSLRLQIKGLNVYDIFDSVYVDSSAPPGKYNFIVERNNYKMVMSSSALRVKDKLVESGSVTQLDSLSINGVSLKFTSAFLKNPSSFVFFIVRQRDAIGMLTNKLTVYDRDLVKGRRKPRSENFVGISLTGKDYRRITVIINTIADEFVKKSLGFKKRKTEEAIHVLEKQLKTAGAQLKVSQDAVQEFRRQHPNIALASELQNSIQNMAMLESNMYNSRASSKDAQRIQNQLIAAGDEEIELVIQEALLFLSKEGVVAASVLQAEFTQLQQQKITLAQNYAKSHPLVNENRSKIALVKAKTSNLLKKYIKTSANSTMQQTNKIQEITQRMQGLPIQQLQLAELERKAQVAAEIHSSVLARFNQAKISDAVEVPDVFIMDYAIEPEPPPNLQTIIRFMAMALLTLLAVSLGPPIIFDLFDKTARTESELIKLLPFTFLESIPVIPSAQKQGKSSRKQKGEAAGKPTVRVIDPKLVTASYTPDFTNELFRSLRSKIMLRLHAVDKKRLLVTSMGMNEGKSLVTANLAITMAQQKLKTILIDGDIRRGVQHNTFVLKKKPGLSDFLFSEDVVTQDSIDELIQPTHVPNLSLIASGPNVPNPSELLGLPRLEELVNLLSASFDILLLDTAPIGAAVDAAIVSNLFNGAIVVIKAGTTNVVALKKRLKEFPHLQKQVLGMVLNQSMLDGSMKKYKYYSYLY